MPVGVWFEQIHRHSVERSVWRNEALARQSNNYVTSLCPSPRVVSMEKRKEQLSHQEAAAASRADDSDSSADEAEVEEFLDWRSKGTWK